MPPHTAAVLYFRISKDFEVTSSEGDPGSATVLVPEDIVILASVVKAIKQNGVGRGKRTLQTKRLRVEINEARC